MTRKRPLVAVLVLLALPAHAQEKRKLAEADYATYKKLRIAERAATIRRGRVADADKRAAIDRQRDAAIAEAGWSRASFTTINGAVESILVLLGQLEKGGDEAEDAEIALAGQDSTTVATVKAHKKELRDREALEEAATSLADMLDRKAAAGPSEKGKDERKPAEKAPERPKDNKVYEEFLPGTWRLDLEATLDLAMANTPEELRPRLREELRKGLEMARPVWTFDDRTFELRSERLPERPAQKGSWRLDTKAQKLVYRFENGIKDEEAKVERRDELLVLGSSVFKKK